MKKAFIAALAVILSIAPASYAREKGSAGLKVISYNIRVGEADDGPNSWEYRYPLSAMMIMDQMPDIFGLQEARDYQKDYLDEFCKGYDCVGVGREDGKSKGEQMDIFYNTKKIKIMKWGTFWLSDTPDTPSMGWDAAYMRTATWALMKEKASGRRFYFVNTHLDHVGVEARTKGLALIVSRIAEMNPDGLPLVLTGDFNATIDDPCMASLSGKLLSARETAVKTDHHATYNGWGDKAVEKVIDHIFYTGFSTCTVYETITKQYGDRKFISDHYPITATLIF